MAKEFEESLRCVWVIFLRAGAVLPFIAILGESGPLFEVHWNIKRSEGLFEPHVKGLAFRLRAVS